MANRKITLALALLAAFVVALVVAEQRKSGKLFSTFPLHEHLQTLYTDQKFDTFNTELSSAIQAAYHIEEQHRLDKVLQAVETDKQNNDNKNTESNTERAIFHNYDAEAIAIYGTADIEYLKNMLKDENYKPIFLQNSKEGMVTIWIINHKDTSLGSYKQLMVTASVASKKIGYNLGVAYDAQNPATLIFPSFGKLSNHARLFVVKSMYDRELNRKFGQQINGLMSDMGSAKFAKTQAEDSSYVNFLFTDEQGNLVLEGKVEEDNSWSSYFKAGWKIFRALGLSGILDLWNAPYVTLKTVGSVSSTQPKFNQMHSDFKLHAHELENYDLKFGDSGVGKQLKDMKFKPAMVVRMPAFQYALTSPKEQTDDNEFNQLGDLRFVDHEKALEHLNKIQNQKL